jgi:hypothetical protein
LRGCGSGLPRGKSTPFQPSPGARRRFRCQRRTRIFGAHGAAILFLALAQVVAVTGPGEYFPWSIPALYAGLAGNQNPGLGRVSYVIIILTSLAGVAGTLLWWEFADETHWMEGM